MNRVIIDENLRAKLRDADELEFCDESGRKLGHFLSEDLYRRLLFDWANARITDEELQRRRQQPGGRTLAEILGPTGELVKYTVVWKPAAEADLAKILTSAVDRNLVSAAADEIDRLLRSSPYDQGESRSGAVRVMFIQPVGVFYEVSEADRLVSVLAVQRISS